LYAVLGASAVPPCSGTDQPARSKGTKQLHRKGRDGRNQDEAEKLSGGRLVMIALYPAIGVASGFPH